MCVPRVFVRSSGLQNHAHTSESARAAFDGARDTLSRRSRKGLGSRLCRIYSETPDGTTNALLSVALFKNTLDRPDRSSRDAAERARALETPALASRETHAQASPVRTCARSTVSRTSAARPRKGISSFLETENTNRRLLTFGIARARTTRSPIQSPSAQSVLLTRVPKRTVRRPDPSNRATRSSTRPASFRFCQKRG